MKIELETPTWYSRESMYSSVVKSTDIVLESACVDFSKSDSDFKPSQTDISDVMTSVASLLSKQTESWFSTPLTIQQLQKRLQFQFQEIEESTDEKWVKVSWVPRFFQVEKKGFVLIFKLSKITSCNPRIPLSFFDAMTPRATTPTDEAPPHVRNILIVPGAGPLGLDTVDDIPLSETLTSFEIRDEHTRERHRLREAKLRAAIARLKVEEMRERYLRQYGDEYFGESSDSESDDFSQDSHLTEPIHKK